jgi:YidC/Oxa1 family membrane protein insertase
MPADLIPCANQSSDDHMSPKKDMTMEQRMLLAFGLMGVVLLVTQFVLPKPQPAVNKAAATKAAPKQEKAPAAAVAAVKPAAEQPHSAQDIVAAAESTHTIETDHYRIVFSNKGAVVRGWVLKKFQDTNGKPIELINRRAVDKTGYPFSVRGMDHQPVAPLNDALWVMKASADKVEFEYAGSGWRGRKTFAFQKASYLTQISSEVWENGQGKRHLLSWRGGFGDETVIGAAASQHSVHYDLDANKLVVQSAGDADDGPLSNSGRYSFAGLEDSYFAAVALPDKPEGFYLHTVADSVANALDGKEEPNTGVAVGGDASNRFSLFVGPKDTRLLRSISPRLEQLVDWGWFGVIAQPLFLALRWLHDAYIPNWGWAIVVLTVVINFVTLPLKVSSLKSMKKMSALQPKIKEINDRYKGMSLRDPKKAEQNQEVMDLYKKHGVNPMGGCMPMLLQIPFFIAFYKVLSVAIELRGADWLWVTDLSRPETIPIRVLPLAMIASQFVMQKMTPSTTADPAQQRIMLMMPLFMGFMFYGVSSGLVLYWMTGNVVGIAQQWFFNKTFHAPEAAAQPEAAKKKSSRK